MAFTPFNFTKSWRNAVDFPTFESDETKVRDDMQSLFDELKVGVNRLIGELKASNIPFTPTAEVDSSDVQNAIENVQAQIAQAILGELPDGSVTTVKLADEAVKTGKIADGAVTSDKLADEAVTAAKLADDAVSTDSLADGAVTGEKIAEGTIGLSKLSSEALNAKADLIDGKVKPSQVSKARVNVTASRALALTDDGKLLYVSSSSAVTLTLPLNSVAQIPVGGEIIVYRAGLGAVAIAGAEGVNITCSAALNSLSQYDTAVLKKFGANDWNVEFNHNPIPAGGVTGNEIADGAVTASKIAAEAVTPEKASAGVLPFVDAISIDTSWVGASSPYSHSVTLSDYTPTALSKVDIQPDATAIAQLIEDGVAGLYIVNNNGTLTAYAVGEKPTTTLNLQVTVEEVY